MKTNNKQNRGDFEHSCDLFILCEGEDQCSAICDELGKSFHIAYAGGVEERPAFTSNTIVIVDLSVETDANYEDIFSADVPCIVNSESLRDFDPLYLRAWRQQVTKQINENAPAENREREGEEDQKRSPRLWALCASTNGPQVLGDFLHAVHPGTGDSFIVLQHLKESFIKSLREHLSKATPMLVLASMRSERIKPNTVYICPPNRTPRIEGGRLFWERKRSKKFSPCIDESLESLATVLGQRLKVIVFTGMGNDCLRGSRKVNDLGGSVWAQSLESATMESMPKSVIEAKICTEVGSPEFLAKRISET